MVDASTRPFGRFRYARRSTITSTRLALLISTSILPVSGLPTITSSALAQTEEDTAVANVAVPCADDATALSCSQNGRVIFRPPFFDQFNPITALDMVRRVPGFSIDGGSNVRGFGGAAGNVLIDGQRPSTKSASIRDLLDRIGATSVERVELIRGGTGGLDVGGQAVVVNVVRKPNEGGRDPSPWEFGLIKRRPDGGLRPNGEITFSGQRGETKYTFGLDLFTFSNAFEAEENLIRFDGDDELRLRDGTFREHDISVNSRLEHSFANGDTARFNFEGGYLRFRDDTRERRFLAGGIEDLVFFTFPLEEISFEVGGDYEHAFSDKFGVKVIGLISREFESSESGFEFLPQIGENDNSIFLSDQTEGEIVGRAEFDWSGWKRHTIQFGTEIAQNFIDSEAQLLELNDAGELAEVEINGANTRVTELRSETFINDSWQVSPKLTIDAGFALEVSRIAQSGDNANSRLFVYPKPSLTFTYNIDPKTQLRLSGERRVNQLSFGQFVSSVNFDDEDVDFGNPDLQPQRTWALRSSIEKRFGKVGVVEVTGFLDLIQDVEDLLPIGGIVEVPGNIGDGQVYGVSLDMTLPFDWIGLKNSQLESNLTLRDSSVTDPVTGLDRELSFVSNYFYGIDFRQDFVKQKFSWGFGINNNGPRSQFGLDEISDFRNTPDIRAFIETTQIKGLKVRFDYNDITNSIFTRARTVFDGSRALNVPLFQEIRDSQNGGAYRLSFSGVF